MAKQTNGGEVRARLTLDNSQFRKNMKNSRSDLGEFDKKASGSKQNLKGLEEAAGLVGIAVAGMASAAVVTAAQFEQSMARVAAVSGASGDSLKSLEDAAKQAGETTVFSANQSADALSYLSMAGFEASESVEALPSVLDLASAAQLDLGQSADIVSNIMTGFSMDTEDTGKAVDVLVETMTSANTNLPQLGEAMKFVAPIAESMGWSIEETATAIAKMSDAGIQGSEAGTALRGILSSLSNPVGQTADAFEDLHLNLEDGKGELLSLPEIVEEVSGAMEGMSDKQKTAYAQMLVGREAASGFLAIIKQGPDELSQYTEGLENSEGAAKKLAETQNNTTQGAWKEFLSAVQAAGIEIGEEFLPEIKAVLENVTDMARGIKDINPELVEFALKFTAGAAAAVTTVSAIKKLTTAVKLLQVGMGPMGWVSLAAGALGGLALSTMDAKENTEELTEVNLDNVRAMAEEEQALDTKLDRYEELRGKTDNANDVLGKYLDLQTRINSESDPDVIKQLKDEQEKLAEKAGLSVDELNEMAEINGKLVEDNPEVVSAYSKNGEAIAGNTDKLREQQRVMLETMELELEKEMAKAKDQAAELADNYNKWYEDWNAAATTLNETKEKQADLDQKANDMRDEFNTKLEEGKFLSDEQMYMEERLVIKAEEKAKANSKSTTEARETLDELTKQKGTLNEQVAESRKVFNEAINIKLQHAEINEKGEEGVRILKEQLQKDSERFLKLEDIKNSQGGLNSKQQEEYDKLSQNLSTRGEVYRQILNIQSAQDGVNGKLDSATGKSRDMVDLLNDDYNIDVYGLDNPLSIAKNISGELSKDEDKGVYVHENGDNISNINWQTSKDETKGVSVMERGNNLWNLNWNASKDEYKGVNVYENGSNLWEINWDASKDEYKDVNVQGRGLYDLQADAQQTLWTTVMLQPQRSASTLWSNPTGFRHSGGTVHQLPKYHKGGNVNKPKEQEQQSAKVPRGIQTPPKRNEVDVRLLRNEMVLTQAQQANLFRMVDTFGHQQAEALSEQGGNVVGESTTISVGSLVVREEADIRRVAEELDRLKRQRQRNVRGR
jgi:TP901 family phage tail tape measure protein